MLLLSWCAFCSGALVVLVFLLSWCSCCPGALVVLVRFLLWWSCCPGILVVLVLFLSWGPCCPGAFVVLLLYSYNLNIKCNCFAQFMTLNGTYHGYYLKQKYHRFKISLVYIMKTSYQNTVQELCQKCCMLVDWSYVNWSVLHG